MGAIISEERLRKVLNDIETAQKGGLLSQQAGTRLYPEEVEGGYYMSPPILTECHDDMASFRNEIFGPVVSVLHFSDDAEAVQCANNAHYGHGPASSRAILNAHTILQDNFRLVIYRSIATILFRRDCYLADKNNPGWGEKALFMHLNPKPKQKQLISSYK